MTEYRLITKGDLALKTGSTTLTIPIGGGCVSKTFCISGLKEIELIVNARIVNTEPKRCDVHAPQVWSVTGTSIVGISLGGVTGTTVTMSVDCLGYMSE